MNITDVGRQRTSPHHLGVWSRIALVLAMATSVLWFAGALWELVAWLTMSFSRQTTFNVHTLLAGVAVLKGASWLSLAALIFLVSLKIFGGRPFSGSITKALSAAGVLFLVAVVLVAALGGVGQKQVMDHIGAERITSQPGLAHGGIGTYINSSIDFSLLVAGLLLLLLAGAFKLGTRFQQDTEGLV